MKKKINPNENNDLKFINGINGFYNPDQNMEDEIITEDGNNKKKEKLEYFTE